RALAVGSAQPSALVPGLPTVAAILPGYEASQSVGILASARTPATAIKRLNQEIVSFLHRPDIRQKFNDAGADIIASTPEQLATKMRTDIVTLGKVIKDAGIKAE